MDDALELLSGAFTSDVVRTYAVEALKKSSDEVYMHFVWIISFSWYTIVCSECFISLPFCIGIAVCIASTGTSVEI